MLSIDRVVVFLLLGAVVVWLMIPGPDLPDHAKQFQAQCDEHRGLLRELSLDAGSHQEREFMANFPRRLRVRLPDGRWMVCFPDLETLDECVGQGWCRPTTIL